MPASAVLSGLVRHLAPDLHVGEPGRPIHPQIVEAHLPSSGCACAVCSGESPRARQSSITATFSRKLSSVSSTLLLVSERTASASFCARRASQNTRGFLLHPQSFLRLHPLQHLGHAPSLGACIPESLSGRMLPCLRLRRRDVAVPLDLVVHGRGRPSQQLRDLPAAVAAVEAFFDQPPLRLRQPHICPGLGLPPFLPGSFGHALSASSCTSSGRPLRPPPHRFRHPSDMYSRLPEPFV